MSEKKKSNTGKKAAGTALILALLAGGAHFGLGIGNPGGGFLNPVQATTQASADATQEATTAPTQTSTEATQPATEEGILGITVQESQILYQGSPVSLAELEQALLRDYKEGLKIRLTDDHAIKSAYDEVAALLTRLQLPLE